MNIYKNWKYLEQHKNIQNLFLKIFNASENKNEQAKIVYEYIQTLEKENIILNQKIKGLQTQNYNLNEKLEKNYRNLR